MRVPRRDVNSWKSLLSVFDRTSSVGENWVFRGQADAKWPLVTSLERARKFHRIPRRDLLYVEGGLIRRFKRQYYHYSADPPDQMDYLEWLAVMQHHGAPTRLLDCTYSLFAAVFFAIESGETPAAVWALNTTRLNRQLKAKLPDVMAVFEQYRNVNSVVEFKKTFAQRPPVPFVCAVNPYRLNPRLTIQQGAFLCPGDISKSFEDNLAALIGRSPDPDVVVKLVVSPKRSFRKSLLQRLHRMNMNDATLFPGLDGFSRSLKQILAFPKGLLPPDNEYLP